MNTYLRAIARPKEKLFDKVIQKLPLSEESAIFEDFSILGGLVVAAWFVMGTIEAKIKNGGGSDQHKERGLKFT